MSSKYLIDLACTYLEIDVGSYLKENRPYMTTEQLKTLCRDGFKLGAHSITHRYFRSTGLEIIENEAVRSCDFVKGVSGQETVPFAFPFNADDLADDFLDGLSNKIGTLGRMYGSRGIANTQRALYNRILADEPPRDPAGTNIPELIRAAYTDELIRLI